jgi:hypothetical protein
MHGNYDVAIVRHLPSGNNACDCCYVTEVWFLDCYTMLFVSVTPRKVVKSGCHTVMRM